MAAFVALGAAALAYTAAMKKVRFDSLVAEQNEKRRKRGIFLRLDYTIKVLRHEADILSRKFAPPESGAEKSVGGSDFSFKQSEAALKEAWDNLDCFSSDEARALSDIKGHFYNFAILAELGKGVIKIKKKEPGEELNTPNDEFIAAVKGHLSDLNGSCDALRAYLKTSTASLME